MNSIKKICGYIGSGKLKRAKKEAKRMKLINNGHAFPVLVLIYLGFSEGKITYQEIQAQIIELLKNTECLDNDSYCFMNSFMDELNIINTTFLIEMYSLLVEKYPEYKVPHIKLAYLFFNDYKKDEHIMIMRNYILRYQDKRNSFQIPIALYLNALLETDNFSSKFSSSLDELLDIIEKDFFPFVKKLQFNELYMCILAFYRGENFENCLICLKTLKLRYPVDFKSMNMHVTEIKIFLKLKRYHEGFIGSLGCILTAPRDSIYFKLCLKALKGVLELDADDFIKLRKKMLTSLISVLDMKRYNHKITSTLCCGCIDFVRFVMKYRVTRENAVDLEEYKCIGAAAVKILTDKYICCSFYLSLTISKYLSIDPNMKSYLELFPDVDLKILCTMRDSTATNVLTDLDSLSPEKCLRSEKALYTISLILKEHFIKDKYLTILCYLSEWKRTYNVHLNYQDFMEEGSSRVAYAEAICHAHIGSFQRAFELAEISKLNGLLKIANGYPIYARSYFACSDEDLNQIFEKAYELQSSFGNVIFDQLETYLCTFEKKIEQFIKIIKRSYQTNNDFFAQMIFLEYYMRLFLREHYQAFYDNFTHVSKSFERKFCDIRGKEMVDIFNKRKSRSNKRASFEFESYWVKYNFEALKLVSSLIANDESKRPTIESFKENSLQAKGKMDDIWELLRNSEANVVNESFEFSTFGIYHIWYNLGLNEVFTKFICLTDNDSILTILQQLKGNVIMEIDKIGLIDTGSKYREFCLIKSTINRTTKFLKNYYSCVTNIWKDLEKQKGVIHSMLDEIFETTLEYLEKLKFASSIDAQTQISLYLPHFDENKIEQYVKTLLENCGDQVELF